MLRALDMFVVDGIQTSIPLHQRILSHPDFVTGRLDTGFLARTGVTGPAGSSAYSTQSRDI
ncbi:MAG: hypothetical protein JO307_25310 [Bryobacterales bacterium]|nr:hypothetical protein [Bryobacterales bacterium]MBV9401094.1 hypothetical protein [Bryobacterales bacterium]